MGAARLVVRVLVERGAGRREQHHLARPRGAPQADLLVAEQALAGPPQRALSIGEAGGGPAAEQHPLALPRDAARQRLRRDRDRPRPLAREDLELGRAVGLEGAMAVEMVLG